MNNLEISKVEPITISGEDNPIYKILEANMAMYYYDKIKTVIETFEERLTENQYLNMEIILNDGSRIVALSFGYYNPNMITVIGLNENNEKIKLILSVNNIQIIVTIKTITPKLQKRKIGFHLENL